MPSTRPLLTDFPTEIPYECNIFAASSTCATHIILHGLITIILFGVQILKLLSMQFPPSSSSFSFLNPNNLHNTLFSKTHNTFSSLGATALVLHAHKSTGNLAVLCKLILYVHRQRVKVKQSRYRPGVAQRVPGS